jgi:L-rhamnose mutarotase
MRVAFKMKLHPGKEEEYRRRHDSLWPELKDLLKESGISDYSIYLDEETNTLFGVMEIKNETKINELPNHRIMKKWWTYMKDIMETNEDHSPLSIPLKEVFYLK